MFSSVERQRFCGTVAIIRCIEFETFVAEHSRLGRTDADMSAYKMALIWQNQA
jgi:hypothetical protein